MWIKLVHSSYLYPFLLIATLISVVAGILSRNAILLPVLNVLVAYPVLFTLVVRQERKRAVAAMLFWALCMGVFAVIACVSFPSEASGAVFHGPEYRDEMHRWIKTGAGAEGDPRQFIPQHVLHFGIFAILSVVSAGVLSLLMGAVLMNYMSFYVSSVILASSDTWTAVWMGWHPWSILRVISFVILGVLLSEPLISKVVRRPYRLQGTAPFLWIALSGLVLDILIKALLAPWWGVTLRGLIEP